MPHLPLLRRLAEIGVHSLTSGPPTLEELFLSHYRIAHTDTAVAAGEVAAPATAGTGGKR